MTRSPERLILIAASLVFAAAFSYPLIWHLREFLFTSMRLPSRFLLQFSFAIAVTAGYGVWGFHEYGAYVSSASITIGPSQSMLALNEANLGAINCYEYTAIPTQVIGSNQKDYQGEQYLKGPGSVEAVGWSPNVLSFEVQAPSPTLLVINQNYARGWVVARGTGKVLADNGSLAVELPAGRQHLKLVYRDDGFLSGLAIMSIAIVAAILCGRSGSGAKTAEASSLRRLSRLEFLSGLSAL